MLASDGVVRGVVVVAVGHVGVVSGLFVIAGLMVFGCGQVMFGCVFVVLRSFAVVLRGILGHCASLLNGLVVPGFPRPGVKTKQRL